ncbi:helix-turn-helix domain-containing protein [Qipengyuania sp. 1NDW9]|uniref:helix-turn-helix domain-containing protein n=1 Tax=Qipengyuania xiapuensis TaxID=2867236 RepID=UPI001C880586|nr:helix-turn-helix domain-containing protein [Qipengyuania xiapuensis]MBX7492651.1 helix-turn-helix domain-containing protein [Qipengyuania xiapuensis]
MTAKRKRTREDTDQPLLVEFADACALLNISRPTLQKMTEDGRIRSVKIGRKHMVPRAEIHRFVNGEAA